MGEIAHLAPASVGRLSLDDLMRRVTIRTIDDIRGAAETIEQFARANALRAALTADISSNEPMVDADGNILASEVFGWLADGERWWEDHRLALHSPLPRSCRYESEPFWCSAKGFSTEIPNHYLDEISLQRYFDSNTKYAAAIVVPMHLPFAQISSSCYVPLSRAQDDMSVQFAEIGETLGLLTRRFIAGYVGAMRTKRRIPSDCELSKREVECLRWAAIGKTDREIAMIIGLSHATVRYHIHRAGEKLNSVNRAQTIFKAGQLGYLGASD